MYEMSADKEIDHLVRSLELIPHLEGGFFGEQYRTDRQVTFIQPNKFDGPRDGGSCIYYLLKSGKYVSFHLPLFDEIFLWHAGGPAKIYTIDSEGKLTQSILGDTLKNGDYRYQVTVRHDTWYAVEPMEQTQYVLFGAVVIPGWALQDWTQGKRADLLEKFPQHGELIQRLCKE